MSEFRLPLTRTLAPADFKRFYWLKAELLVFCREHNIPTSGGKLEIAARIEHFLATGEVSQPEAMPRRRTAKRLSSEPLSLQTVITEDFRCSQENRHFFEGVIGPQFHFSTHMQRFARENMGKTYQDFVDEWYREQAVKKEQKTEIAPQFEYNRFMRTFRDQNPKADFKDAVAAWNAHKRKPKT